MDASTSQERNKREIQTQRAKIGKMCPAASTRKNAEARRYRAFRERKRGTEKICPPAYGGGCGPGFNSYKLGAC
jgi:hypothetical protein